MNLFDDIRFIPGVGPKKARYFYKNDVKTVEDFLFYLIPRKLLDKREPFYLASIREDGEYFVRVRIFDKRIVQKKKGEILECVVYDGTGSATCWWFNGLDYYSHLLKLTEEYFIYGRVVLVNGRKIFMHPEVEEVKPLRAGHIEPRYPEGEIFQKVFFSSHRKIKETIEKVLNEVSPSVSEFLPSEILSRFDLPERKDAFYMAHLPSSFEEHERALKRFKVEEIFSFLLKTRWIKERIKREYKGIKIENAGELIHEFYNKKLDFKLTEAQKRVTREIRRDLASGKPMNRLLQGDVGSGKTIVALMTILIMTANHYQSCLMAPTEILAMQHFSTFQKYLFGLPVMVELLVGSTSPRKKREIKEALKKGYINVLIGTHALIEEDVEFHRLGLVVIDEQHKFGVIQRKKLLEKARDGVIPHVLVMSATPIPRTIAMTIYGDMDVSTIDQMPPGKKPPVTRHYYHHQRELIRKEVYRILQQGEQAYWVFPIISPSEKLYYENLEEGFLRLKTTFGNDFKIGVLHGKMSYDEKKRVVEQFRRKEIDILAATPVIEVGIDVPSANLMVIESAEKFGLSQLHQLRGRVGRAGRQGFCFVVTSTNLTESARARISAILQYTSGFKIAEIDLQLRGPGDMLGVEQSGQLKHFRFANMTEDTELFMKIGEFVNEFVNKYPDISTCPYHALRDVILKKFPEDAMFLMA